MGKLIALLGRPRSGKSTYSREFIEYQDFGEHIDREVIKEKRVVVNGDAVRKALTGERYFHELESTVFAHCEIFLRTLLNEGYTVCFDECNTSICSLFGIFKLDPNAEIKYFDTSEEECIKRALALKQDYLVPTIRRASKNLTYLSKCYGAGLFGEKPCIIKGVEYVRDWVNEGLTLNELFIELSGESC